MLIFYLLGNLNLSRSLGDMEYKQNKKMGPEDQMITAYPDVVVENLTNDINFIVIACDGIWDCLTNQECCDFIIERLRKDPKMKLSKIVEEMFDTIVASDIYTGIYLIHLIKNIYNTRCFKKLKDGKTSLKDKNASLNMMGNCR